MASSFLLMRGCKLEYHFTSTFSRTSGCYKSSIESHWRTSRGLLCKWTTIRTDSFLFSRADNARSLNDIESTLPAETEAKEAAIDQALVDRAAKFLSTHTVELSLPEDVSRSFDEGKISYDFFS